MTYKLAQGLSDGRYPNWHQERYSNYSGRFQPGLDSPLIINSRTTLNASIDLGGSRSRGFWGGFLDGLMGRNAYGVKTGIGILDIAAFWAMGKLMGTSRTTPTGSSWFGGTGLYTGSSGSLFANNNLLGSGIGDSFSLANSKYTSYTPTGATPAAAAPDTKAKPAATENPESKKAAANDDDGKTKKKTGAEQGAATRGQAAADDVNAKNKAEAKAQEQAEANAYPSADDFNKFVDGKGAAIIHNTSKETLDVKHKDRVDNLEAGKADEKEKNKKAENGYYEYITITDKSGNTYTLNDPQVDDKGVLTYKVFAMNLTNDDGNEYAVKDNDKYKLGTRLKITIDQKVMKVINNSNEAIATFEKKQ